MKTLENAPQAEKKPKFNLKSKKLKIAAIVLVGVVALGGVAGALVIKSIKNRPENVAAKSISNYLFGLKDGGKQKMTIKVSSADNPMANVELGLDAITTKDLGAAQLNFEASVSAFRLRGMIQVAENGNLYIKLKDLPLLLNSASGVQTGLPPEMVSQIETLGEKWIEITQDDIKSLSGNT
ncbi:MAG: hypothetical protein QG623_707, partial [Patescibacteria group bacterium]|nr:hypothetical protein [Patescibacteria group bacterium]